MIPDGAAEGGTAGYRAFGLGLLSEIPLPELPPAPDLRRESADLVVRRAPLPEAWRAGARGAAFAHDGQGSDLWWEAVGGFRVRGDGHAILADPAPGVGDDIVAFPLLGPVLALALHFRRRLVLHASAVALPSRSGGGAGALGVGLLGDKGAGKSTTAAALLAAGGRLLTDDLLVVDDPGGRPSIPPGWGQVKLAAEAEGRFAGGEAVSRPAVHESIGKTRVLVADRLARSDARLARLYLLERDPAATVPRVEPCGAAEALPLLLAHAYAARFGEAILGGGRAPWHFRAVAALAGSGVLGRLRVPVGLEGLDAVMEVVRADVEGRAHGAARP